MIAARGLASLLLTLIVAALGAGCSGASRDPGASAVPRTIGHRSAATGSASTEGSPAPLVSAVESVTIVVSDLDRSIGFYRDVLGFAVVSTAEHSGDELEQATGVFASRTLVATLLLGDERIELVQFLAPEGRQVPADSRSNDHWFQHIAIVVSDLDAAYAHLRAHKVRHASSGPQTLPDTIPAASGISAFYFKDPDGHVLEVIHFPPGKGDTRWQRAPGSTPLFLGIDHTAIVVSDTQRSLDFYAGVLGMTIAGGSENFGIQQERLNGVYEARLRITTLRAPHGPGVELLEYLSPPPGSSDAGRPYPSDSRLNDLWSWRTNVRVADASAARAVASDSIVALPPRRASANRVGASGAMSSSAERLDEPFSIRDPDGHVITITPGQTQQAGLPHSRTHNPHLPTLHTMSHQP